MLQGHERSSRDATMVDCQLIERTKWRRRNVTSAGGTATVGAQDVSVTVREIGPWSMRVASRARGNDVRQRNNVRLSATHMENLRVDARYVCRVCNRTGQLQQMCLNILDQHCMEATTAINRIGNASGGSEVVISYILTMGARYGQSGMGSHRRRLDDLYIMSP